MVNKMNVKKLLIILVLFFSLILVACDENTYNFKVKDSTYNQDDYTVDVTVDFSSINNKDSVYKYGILYELTKVDKITNLNFGLDGVYNIEIEKENNESLITFTIENVNKFVQVSYISIRPYVIERENMIDNKTLSPSYKVIVIDSKYPTYNEEPTDPVIDEIHINTFIKGESNYRVTTDDENITVMFQVSQDYSYITIFIMANVGYTFSDEVKLYENNDLVTSNYTIDNNNKQITYKFNDPNWTNIY